MKNTLSLAWHLSCSLNVRLWCIVRWPDENVFLLSGISPLSFDVIKKNPPPKNLSRPHERSYSRMYHFKDTAVDLVAHVSADWRRTVCKKWELWKLWMCVPNSSASHAVRRQWGANVSGCCATFSWTRPSCLELATSLRMKPCLTLAFTRLWRYEQRWQIALNERNLSSQKGSGSCIIEPCFRSGGLS